MNFLFDSDLGPGVFVDSKGNRVSECPFPGSIDHAPVVDAAKLYPDWFHAFRSTPQIVPPSQTASFLEASAAPVKTKSVRFIEISIANIDIKLIPKAVFRALYKSICFINIIVSSKIDVKRPLKIARLII